MDKVKLYELYPIYDIGPYSFDGKYSCTPDGKIFSNISYQYLKPFTDGKRGYLKVKLYDNRGKPVTIFVHRIICTVFHGDFPDLQVNHINGEKLDNFYKKLEWLTLEKM